eukprot:scaffold11728_cov171-Amphora_coffeaeformis.AAC.5
MIARAKSSSSLLLARRAYVAFSDGTTRRAQYYLALFFVTAAPTLRYGLRYGGAIYGAFLRMCARFGVVWYNTTHSC